VRPHPVCALIFIIEICNLHEGGNKQRENCAKGVTFGHDMIAGKRALGRDKRKLK